MATFFMTRKVCQEVIVDSSAWVAILRGEPEGVKLLRLIDEAPYVGISVATYLETAIVIDGTKDAVASRELDDLLVEARAVLEPVTAEQGRIAREAYRDFGRGSGHPAKLNFGDCFAYALARVKREPLLCKGDDFIHTDLKVLPAR
jgi:ribonuclease VapC